MRILKTVCAILLSFALVMSQTVFAPDASAAIAKNVKCCCGPCKMKCCALPASPVPQPLPAAPRSVSQNQVQLIAVTVSLLLHLPEQRVEKQISLPAVSVSLISLPLYTRNCSFLI
jgi:hypothetical protein